MTQLQKLAWLNLIYMPLLAALTVAARMNILPERVLIVLWCCLLAAVLGATILMAKMPWHKGTAEDERDRLFRRRSFAAAYLAVLSCLAIGLVVSAIAFPGQTVPLTVLAGIIGGSFVVSVLAQSVAVLVQYRRGI